MIQKFDSNHEIFDSCWFLDEECVYPWIQIPKYTHLIWTGKKNHPNSLHIPLPFWVSWWIQTENSLEEHMRSPYITKRLRCSLEMQEKYRKTTEGMNTDDRKYLTSFLSNESKFFLCVLRPVPNSDSKGMQNPVLPTEVPKPTVWLFIMKLSCTKK